MGRGSPTASCAAQTLVPLVSALESWGIESAPLLRVADLRRADLDRIDRRITWTEVQAVWQAAYERAEDPALGLHVAATLRRDGAGYWTEFFTYLAASSASGRDAFERALRYVRIVHEGLDLQLRVEGDLSICEIHAPTGGQLTRMWSEYSIAGVTQLTPEIVGERRDIEAWFVHEAPDYADEYEPVLGMPVRFGAPCDAIVGPAATLSDPLPRSDSQLCRFLERQAEQQMAKLPPDQDRFSDLVRSRIISTLEDGDRGSSAMAKALGVSDSTLRRKLRAESTSYQQILDEVRFDMAREMLVDQDLSPHVVTFLLGFSDASAFHKAFRRWAGVGPAEFARSRKPEGT